MGRTFLTGGQVKDGSVQKVDLDTTSTGQAVITKVIAGTNISISSTGVDAGTGDVTVSLGGTVASDISSLQSSVSGKADSSSLATVATSGSYNDLTNKPSIPSITGLASETYVDTKVADLVASAPATLDTLNELAAALGDDASFSTTVTNSIAAKANSADLAAVATSGSYADLTNKPSIPSITGLASETYVDTAVAGKANSSSLATVATTGAYDDLTGKPSLFSGSYTDLTNKPSLFDGAYSSLTGVPTLATVATSGSYADLTGKPTLASFATLTSPSSGQFLKYNGTAWVNFAVAYADVTGTPTLATVATSGSYADLTGKPTVPSALDDLSDVVITSSAKGQFVVHNGTSYVNARTIEADAAATKVLILKGAASQSGNLLEFQDSSGTALATFSSGAVLQLKYLYPTGAYGSTQNVCVGVNAGNAIFATEVVAIGQNAMQYNVSGQNVAIGHSALKGVSGSSASDMNTCVGAYSGASITSGPHNTLIGYYAGSNITTGAGNIIIGRHAPGNTNAANGSSYNVAIGYGTTVTGNNAVNISGGSTATGGINIKGTSCGTNAISLGASAAASNDCLDIRFGSAQRIVGDASGLIGINEATPGAQLHITSGAAARKGLIVKAAASPTANLVEVNSSTNELLFGVLSNGTVKMGTSGSATSTVFGNNAGAFRIESQGTESCFSIVSPDNGSGKTTFNLTRVPADAKWNMSTGAIGLNIVTGAFSWTGVGIDLPSGTGPGAKLHVNCDVAAKKGQLIKAHASQSETLFEVQNSSGTAMTLIQSNGTLHAKRYTQNVCNAFNTSLAPSSGTLTVDTSLGNVVLGALNASVTTWAFTNVPTENSKMASVTVIIDGNTSYTYGDACSVNGNTVTNGIMWIGGSAPTATDNYDVIKFDIVKDSAGTINVFGYGSMNFS